MVRHLFPVEIQIDHQQSKNRNRSHLDHSLSVRNTGADLPYNVSKRRILRLFYPVRCHVVKGNRHDIYGIQDGILLSYTATFHDHDLFADHQGIVEIRQCSTPSYGFRK
ncbi:unnamed protein product [Acanthoscelides obtectus]|uniref:Uncharacterized protein n=1 Tax=Acanthoscelides obtectus TaxID=200917 RepID=A0A9P0JRJ1_ACAOB|nr:unnamed protein product [Acanthoscelides obtectus]CAK1679119.1 hypothetical protein AOBTE_LOCUS32131 [Acanthoscelides obtectus]